MPQDNPVVFFPDNLSNEPQPFGVDEEDMMKRTDVESDNDPDNENDGKDTVKIHFTLGS